MITLPRLPAYKDLTGIHLDFTENYWGWRNMLSNSDMFILEDKQYNVKYYEPNTLLHFFYMFSRISCARIKSLKEFRKQQLVFGVILK